MVEGGKEKKMGGEKRPIRGVQGVRRGRAAHPVFQRKGGGKKKAGGNP